MTRPNRSRFLWPMLASGAIAFTCVGRPAGAQDGRSADPPRTGPQQDAPAAPSVASLSLGEVVAMAKERAPAVHAAFARIASAEAGVDRANAARLPSAYLQGSGTAFATNGQVYQSGVTSTASNEWYMLGSGALNLQWTLYDFGHTQGAVHAAAAGVNAAKLSARATEQTAMAEAAVAFFTLLADDDLVRSAAAAQVDRDHVVTITHHLVEAGYRTRVDETRAQIALDVAKLDLSMASAARDGDSVTLATALLLDPATTFRLAAPQPLSVDDGAASRGTLDLRARRDVAAAAARVEQARRNVDSATRARLPVIAASGSGQALYSHDSATAPACTSAACTTLINVTTTSNSPTELVQGTLTVTFPLFDATINANVRAAEASLGEAQANLEQITLTARGEALQAARQAHNARTQVDQAEHLAAGTAANLAAVEDRYSTGMEGPLELADAQREEAGARVAIVRARLAYDVAAVRLLEGVSRADELLKAR